MLKNLLPVLAFAAAAGAQQLMLPERAYFHQTTSTSQIWRSTSLRFQEVYDTTHFLSQGVTGPIAILRLRFRAADGAIDAGGAVYSAVNVNLSSCPLNYASASTTFATNRGADNQLCYSGAVTTLPVTGTTPNDHFIDITLTNPFLYDPTLGLDLVIEVDASAPSATVPSSAAVNRRCRRVTAASPTATTGTGSATAGTVLVDFGGTGGYSTWSEASVARQGNGCYLVAKSFYELFPDLSQFDLSNTTLTLIPNGSGGYDVVRSAGATFAPHGPTHLGLTDDDVAVMTLPPGFGAGFPFPGGSTTVVSICSNGFVFLGNDLTPDFPDPLFMLIWLTGRLAPFWCDLVPDPTNNVHYDVDPSGQAIYVTWNNVPTFTAGGVANVQLMMQSNGLVQYRIGTCVGAPLDVALVGWSAGSSLADPGSIDLSTLTSFSTSGPDQAPLELDSTLPYIGTALTTSAFNVPAAAPASIRMIATGPLPGVDLGFLGAPGCALWIDPGTAIDTQFGTLTPDVDFVVNVPNDITLLGGVVYCQAAAFHAPANAFGVLTSNQITLTIGNS